MLKRQFAVLVLILSLTAGFGFKCDKKQITDAAKELAVRALLAITAAPGKVDRLPISEGNKTLLKAAIATAGSAYQAYKDGKGTWGAFLAAFSEIVKLQGVNGWVGDLISALRNLLSISVSDASMASEAVEEGPNLKELKEADVKRLEALVK